MPIHQRQQELIENGLSFNELDHIAKRLLKIRDQYSPKTSFELAAIQNIETAVKNAYFMHSMGHDCKNCYETMIFQVNSIQNALANPSKKYDGGSFFQPKILHSRLITLITNTLNDIFAFFKRKPSVSIGKLQAKLEQEKLRGNQLIQAAEIKRAIIKPPLIGNEAIFTHMKTALPNTVEEALILHYKIDSRCDGENDLMEALESLSLKAQTQNTRIRVRILANRRKGLASLVRPNGESNAFHLGKNFPHLDFQYAEHTHQAFGSYHAKMMIIDNQTAMLSTSDLSKHRNYKAGTPGWHEVATIVEGRAAVNCLRNDFIRAWNSTQSNPLTGDKLSIPAAVSCPSVPSASGFLAPTLFIAKKAQGNLLKRGHLSPFTLSVIEAINLAENRISIMTTNLNNPEVIEALANANHRGIQVEILLGKETNDPGESKFFMGGTNRNGITALKHAIDKRGNIHPQKIFIRWTTNTNGDLASNQDADTVHGRVIMVDDITFLGSSTLDQQSVHHSKESDVIIESAEVRDMYYNLVFRPEYEKGINAFGLPIKLDIEMQRISGYTTSMKYTI